MPVVRRDDARVVLVNFPLLKELGLLALDAPNELTSELRARLLRSFALKVSPTPTGDVRVASRYSDGGLAYDSGKGDGRAVWVGELRVSPPDDDRWWIADVSTKGTGATGLEFDFPGHFDGLEFLVRALSEYQMGEVFHRAGVASASRVLAILEIDEPRFAPNGEPKRAAVSVRVNRTNLRFAHLWAHRERPEALRTLLAYHFTRDSRYAGLSFEASVSELVELNAYNAGRETGLHETLLYAHHSPSRGNRLISGELVDWGTTQVLGLYLADWWAYRVLGTVQQQKWMAGHWTRVLRDLLMPFGGDVDVDRIFEGSYDAAKQRANLLRLGVERSEAEVIERDHPALARSISKHLDSVRTLLSSRRAAVDGVKMRVPVIDFRCFVRLLPFTTLDRPPQPLSTKDVAELVSRTGSIYRRHAFNVKRLRTEVDGLYADVHALLGIVATLRGTSPLELAHELELTAAERNHRPRGSSRTSRLDQFDAWTAAFLRGDLDATIERDIDDSVDFELAPRMDAGMSHDELHRRYGALQRDWSSLGRTPDPERAVRVRPWLLAALPSLPSSAGELVEALGLAALKADREPSVRRGLRLVALRPEATPGIVLGLLCSLGAEVAWAQRESLREEQRAWRRQMAELPELARVALTDEEQRRIGEPVVCRLLGDGHRYAVEVLDATGRRLFRDGPRSVIVGARPNGELVFSQQAQQPDMVPVHALSFSFDTAETVASHRERGLYRLAFRAYATHLSHIPELYLTSENDDTVELVHHVRRTLGDRIRVEHLLALPGMSRFLVEHACDVERLLDRDPLARATAATALIGLCAQGRAWLKGGWHVAVNHRFFAAFNLTRLESTAVVRRSAAIETLDATLGATLDGPLRFALFRALPTAYVRFLARRIRDRRKSA